MKNKIKFVYLPFLLLSIATLIGYTFLHWLLLIKLELLEIKSIYVELAGPLIVAGIAALFFIRPRLKLLNLQTKKRSWKDFYTLLAGLFLLAPLMTAQYLLETATGELTALTSISAIDKQAHSKYYTIENYYIDKYKIGVHNKFEESGKHNENFDMHIYIALPVFEQASDTAGQMQPLAWLGLEYQKTVSSRLEPEEKEKAFAEFADNCQLDFDKKDLSDFSYLARIDPSDEKDGFLEAIKAQTTYKINQNLLVAEQEPFENRNGIKVELLLIFLLAGHVLWLIMILIPTVDPAQLQRVQEKKPDLESKENMKEFINFLKPRDGYFVTPLLIYANVGIYLLMVFAGLGILSFESEDLVSWGANYGPLTKQGEIWRLFTSTFLHGGLIHLLANMYGLLFVGVFLEPLLGKTKYLIAYVLTGILASCASLWWYDATVSVGASGAIFGLYGIFLALLVSKTFTPDFAKTFLMSTLVFVGINLLMGLTGGIDNAAHIGGLISGFIIGLLFRLTLKNREQMNR